MKILPITLLAATAAIAGSASASANTMYKCTGPTGKFSFSDQPCAGNSKAKTLGRIRAAQNRAYRLEQEERKRKIQEAEDAEEARKGMLERLRARGQQGM